MRLGVDPTANARLQVEEAVNSYQRLQVAAAVVSNTFICRPSGHFKAARTPAAAHGTSSNHSRAVGYDDESASSAMHPHNEWPACRQNTTQQALQATRHLHTPAAGQFLDADVRRCAAHGGCAGACGERTGLARASKAGDRPASHYPQAAHTGPCSDPWQHPQSWQLHSSSWPHQPRCAIIIVAASMALCIAAALSLTVAMW